MMEDSALDLWHERLVQKHKFIIRRMQKKNIAFGLNPTKLKVDGTCEPCLTGKMSNTTLRSKLKTRNGPGEVIHTDVCSMDKPSLGGSRYIDIFTDECTGYLRLYAIKTEGDAAELFLNHKSASIDKLPASTKSKAGWWSRVRERKRISKLRRIRN